MHDQAAELRQLVRRQRPAGAPHGMAAPLVVVSGGKGGVGTTTVAANLAVALARQGRRAVFVDADLDHGGNARLAGSAERGSIVDVLSGRRSIHEVLERGPAGIQAISGAWASGEVSDYSPAAQDKFIAELSHLTPHADVVVLDAGSSRTHFARRCWQAASAVVVVTTNDSQAIMNAYAAIKALAQAEAPAAIHTLANLADDAREADELQSRVAAACRKFLALRSTAAGCIPTCQRGRETDGVMVFPARSTAARAMDRVADTLWAQLQVGTARQAAQRRQSDPVASSAQICDVHA
jgi:MinD-like ATPase involved in chromosome partitioning or flagellar assembly